MGNFPFDLPPAEAQPFDVNRLPEVSKWPERLLGLSPWTPAKRTSEHILREYDRDKYGEILQRLRQVPNEDRTAATVQQLLSPWAHESRIVSFRDRLYEVDRATFQRWHSLLLFHAVLEHDTPGAIVELGAGFGYQLSLLRDRTERPLLGGELSPNALRLGAQIDLAARKIQLHPFDFLSPQTYAGLLAAAGAPATIFTSHSVSMLPTAEPFVEALRQNKDRVAHVVHLEPTVGLFDSPTLLDGLRRSYAIANDYNLDLMSLLEAAPDVTILRREKDVLGQNPLTPFNLVVWRFR